MFAATRKRDTGRLAHSPYAFQNEVYSSLSLVERLERAKTLEGHAGCVNTVSFNDSGELLISGSDDKRVIVWNWYTGSRVLSYRSGHHNNIFQARFLPHSNNHTIITCAADGQVRVGDVMNMQSGHVSTSSLATHGSRAHKLALDPAAPQCFYSCGEDGRVFHYDLRCHPALQSHLTCLPDINSSRPSRLSLNSIHCNQLRPWQFVVGGSDIFARVYDQRNSLLSVSGGPSRSSHVLPLATGEPVRKLAPKCFRRHDKQLSSRQLACHITCAVFSKTGEVLATYNDENIHLFASDGPDVRARIESPEASGVSRRTSRRRTYPGGQLSKHGTGEGSVQANDAGAASSRPPAAFKRRADAGLDRASGSPEGSSPTRLKRHGQSQPHASESQQPASREHGDMFELQQARPGQGLDEYPAETPGATNSREAGNSPDFEILTENHGLEGTIDDNDMGGQPNSDSGNAARQNAELSFSPAHASRIEAAAGLPPAGSSEGCESSSGSSISSSGQGSDDSKEDSGLGSSEYEEEDDYRAFMEVDTPSSDYDAAEAPEEDEDLEADVGAVVMTAADKEAFLNGSQEFPQTGDLTNFNDEVIMSYSGHRNSQTVKGVSFLGEDDRFVMSGSDDGHIYIWTKADGILRQWLKGDTHVVNCLEPHPGQPLSFATSGIDDDIKLWTPTATEPAGVPEKAWATIDRNKKAQGPRRIPTASARQILMRLHHLAQSREDRQQQRGAADVPNESAEVSRDFREVLQMHSRLRGDFEDGDGEENPDYSPGECAIS